MDDVSEPTSPVRSNDIESTELLFQLGMAFQLMLEEFVSRMDAAGYADLRPIHGLVFQSLLQGATTSSEIGAALGVTKQAAGQIVNDLEEAGYLRRGEHPGGGRRRLVSLAEKGYTHLRTAGRVLQQLEQEVEPGFASGSSNQLRADLTSLIRQFAAGPLPPFRPIW